MIAFTCPHCGGSIHYDISSRDVKCEYCDSLITLASYQEYLDRKNSYQTTELVCPQCGAVTLSYDNTIATFCSYCGSSVVFDRRVREEQKPDGILPFAVKKEDALARYREKTGAVLLAPDWMREEGDVQITGLYVPFYEYSAVMEQPGQFRGSVSRTVGRYTEVSEYEVSGTVRADYRGTRFDAAMAFPDAMSESVDDFDWQRAEAFRPGYVAGFYADGSDVEGAEYDPVAMTLIQQDIGRTGLHYGGMTFHPGGIANDENVILRRKKMLFPMWLLTHRVGKDRICYAAVNGRTGSTAADIPLDGGKFVKAGLIAAALISVFLNFSYTIKPPAFLLVSMLITAAFGVVLGGLANDLYVREHHLDDIGRVGFETFASSLKRSIFRKDRPVKEPRKRGGCALWIVIGLAFFVGMPLLLALIRQLFPKISEVSENALTGLAVIVFLAQFVISAISRKIRGGQVRMRFNVPKFTSFSVMWKIWIALAAGAVVYCSGTVGDNWYYGAGILNILVSVWGAVDLIRKQNQLASREIPVFTMKRGGRE
ncbi:MAG: zinc ribbon domain-containing protein [Lachnospiraceae bacterium]|nr:zinc ribbon domain-containing protein [Lachnospiraceae bacterium]